MSSDIYDLPACLFALSWVGGGVSIHLPSPLGGAWVPLFLHSEIENS